jgi:hypothetical protein
MRRIICASFLSGIFLLPMFVFASTSMEENTSALISESGAQSVADINLFGSKIVSKDEQHIRVAFDIRNNAGFPQSDIRYGVSLMRTKDKEQVVVDSFVTNETLVIGGGELIHREISYPVPTFLDGEYDVMVIAKTTGGLTLGLGSAGKATFSGVNDRIGIVSDSCFLTISGDKNQYQLMQGVDVLPEEDLALSCSLENRSGKSLSVSPYFDTFRRSVYGSSVKIDYPDQVATAFAPREKKVVSIIIPKATEPQAYDTTVSFVKDGETVSVSEKVTIHYVVHGASATIQTVALDREQYVKGEKLVATLYWTPSADGFIGSRIGEGTKSVGYVVVLSVTDSKGRACIEPKNQQLSVDGDQPVIFADVISVCERPTATVSLRDLSGKILDERTIESVRDTANNGILSWFQSESGLRIGLYIFVGVLFLVSIGLIVFRSTRSKKRSRKGTKTLIFFVMVLSGTLLFSPDAKAVTWDNNLVNKDYSGTFSNGLPYSYSRAAAKAWSNYTVSAAETINSGENLTLNWASSISGCGNTHPISITANIKSRGHIVNVASDVLAHASSGTAVIPSYYLSTGTNDIELKGCIDPGIGEQWCGTSMIYLTVNDIDAGGTTPPPTASTWVRTPQVYMYNDRCAVKGDTIDLGWSTTWINNEGECVGSGDWAGVKPSSDDGMGWNSKYTHGYGSVTLSSAKEYQFGIVCTENGKSGTATAYVSTVPSVHLQVYPRSQISPSGEQSFGISWSTCAVRSCAASGDWSGGKDDSGYETVSLTDTKTHTYTLTCKDGDGNNVSQTVTAAIDPILVLSATPSEVSSGSTSTLSWKLIPSVSAASGYSCSIYDTDCRTGSCGDSYRGDRYDYGHTAGSPFTGKSYGIPGSAVTEPLVASKKFYAVCKKTSIRGGKSIPDPLSSPKVDETLVTVISPDGGTPPSTTNFLTLCNSYGSPIPPSLTMLQGTSQSITAHYGTMRDDCSGADVTADRLTVFSENSGDDTLYLSGIHSSVVTIHAEAEGSEVVSATHLGATDQVSIGVSRDCAFDCQANQHCTTDSYEVRDSCGALRRCSGTRVCDGNWKEVPPGI